MSYPKLLIIGLTAAWFCSIANVSDAQSVQRGYKARACGFDLDGDGIVGEAGDDCNICDGVTKDPDKDGKNEDLRYVDCDGGKNSASCGAPGDPCKSLHYTIKNRVDGPGDGAEDIICFTGRCVNEDYVQLGTSGIKGSQGNGSGSGYYTRAKKGNEVRNFQYPQNPFMIVGWDRDNDGKYPPMDSDDKSVIDGGPNKIKRLFTHNTGKKGDPSSLEFAHFTIRNYGRGDFGSGDASSISDSNELWKVGSTTESKHVYFHDLSLDHIMHNQETDGHNIIWDVFTTREGQWWAFENNECIECGGYIMRGAANMPGLGGNDVNAESSGFIRFKNNSWSYHVADENDVRAARQSDVSGIKIWGDFKNVEILDNISDASMDDWNPSDPFNAGAFVVVGCSVENFHIVNNEMIDLNQAIALQPDTDGQNENCGTISNGRGRRQKDINILRNLIRFTDRGANYYSRVWGIFLESSSGPWDESTENAVIANNIVYNPGHNFQSCIEVATGTGNSKGCQKYTGQILVMNNICYGGIAGAIEKGAYSFFARDTPPSCKHSNVVLKNNIAAGLGSDQRNVWVGASWDGLTNDYNVFDPDGDFRWTSGNSKGRNSVQCQPKFAKTGTVKAPTNGDLHLASGDSCAVDAGTSVSSVIEDDLDCGKRPQGGGWDAGPDEVGAEGECFVDPSTGSTSSGTPKAPPAPVLREAIPLPN